MRFNSIKVRLERDAIFLQNLLHRFQFHKGAIRTYENTYNKCFDT